MTETRAVLKGFGTRIYARQPGDKNMLGERIVVRKNRGNRPDVSIYGVCQIIQAPNV